MGEKMLTAKEFAQETGISYPVVIKWLKAEKIPAEQTNFNVWQIPVSVVERFKKAENKPRKGRPPSKDGVKPKTTAKRRKSDQ